jgi:lactate permease
LLIKPECNLPDAGQQLNQFQGDNGHTKEDFRMWTQVYDPLNNWVLSTIVAALPIAILLGGLAFHLKAHIAALLGLLSALIVTVFAFGMPFKMAAATSVYGAAFGLMPIGWIILNVIFMYKLTVEAGLFSVLQDSLTGITNDARLQVVLIAFCFGAFFEGAAGFGTPVAVTAAILIGLGFKPLQASGLSLIANTAPVAYGALGTPIIALSGVTGIDILKLSAMVGHQLPFFSIIVPFWLIWAFCGFKKMWEIWPALLVAGVFFAVPQYLVSTYHGPWLVDVIAAIVSMTATSFFMLKWHPKTLYTLEHGSNSEGVKARALQKHDTALIRKAWVPWIILSVLVFIWGMPQWKKLMDSVFVAKFPVAIIHNLIQRVPPVVPAAKAEAAVYAFNILSATGTGILIAAFLSALFMGFSVSKAFKMYGATIKHIRYSLLTVAAMLGIGFLTRYSGLDATLGLALAKTGVLYPFFGTLIGWLGVALTGSDTSSNVLFGSFQKITAEQVGISPTLMAAANSSGGVMGKMIDAQSIVVASTATNWYGHEGDILRYVFFHSLALASLVGVLVFLQAYVYPFTALVVK